MLFEAPEVILVGALGQRTVANLADAPALLQPVGGVLVHRGPGRVIILAGRLGLVAGEYLPDRDAGAQLRDDHLSLTAPPGLGPTVDVTAEHDGIALSLVSEPRADARCSVRKLSHFDAAAWRARHHALRSRLEDDMIPGRSDS